MKDEQFLDILRKASRKRIPLSVVTATFLKVFTEYEDHPNYREPLEETLNTMATDGLVILPKGKRLWDTVGSPKLPVWVEVVEEKGAGAKGFDEVAWLPELSPIAAQLAQQAQLRDLEKINAYLIENRNRLRPVPFRERSLKIFGDEHYLDSKIRKGHLFGGRLPLDVLFAVEANEPMPYERPPSLITGKPLLIVENHHSFASFVQANAEQNAFSAICYASGNTFASREFSLESIGAKVGTNHFLYLGDIDPRGLSIPLEVNSSRRKRGVPEIKPATGFYVWLLENGRPGPLGKRQSKVDWEKIGTWFLGDKFVSQKISQLFNSNKRIPQENIGLEELLHIDLDFCTLILYPKNGVQN